MTDYLTATRDGYDAIAEAYVQRYRNYLAHKPFDVAMLDVFAGLARGTVADVGSGPGEVSAHFAARGVAVTGIDLSPRMVELARAAFPELRFEVGSMTALPYADGSRGGLVAWYSTIHVPDTELPAVFAEFARVLAPGAPLLLAFQVGDTARVYTEAFGAAVSLTFIRRQPESVAALLPPAGFALTAQLVRAADGDEPTAQAFLVAVRADG